MGLYDNVIINVDMLNVSDEDKVRLKNQAFQTKDFDNEMTDIHIEDDGRIKIKRFDYQEVPVEERPYPNAEGLLAFMGSIREVNVTYEYLTDLHGYFKFYTSVGDEQFKFKAKFTDGKLIKIDRI